MTEETRESRMSTMKEIISSRSVRNQQHLVELLGERGFSVNQSSVSRDLRELRVAKIAGAYELPHGADAGADALRAPNTSSPIHSVVTAGDHMIVLHTSVGAASLLALTIDRSGWTEALGTIAGDDTIFLATRNRREQRILVERLRSL